MRAEDPCKYTAPARPSLFLYRLTIAYDGTAYAGWQVQPNHPTIQQRLEEVIAELTGDEVKIHGSGRTDQGVHARGQEAHVELSREWRLDHLRKGLNALLPSDIRILDVHRAKAGFHARRSAVCKEYRYLIWNNEVMDPCRRLHAAHIRKPLNIQAMKEAADVLVGRHDFSAFTANPNREVKTAVRNINYLKVRKSGSLITVIVASEGFLYKMVRSICGLLIRVGEGAVETEEVREILMSRVRTARVPTAPPEGLFLWKVWY